MSENHFYVPESAMAIVAHPDDIEFSCSGTLARWAQAGARISYVLCTSGDVGIAKQGMTNAQAIEIREAEQRAAAEIIGAEEVIFLREPDGMLQATIELRKKLVREIRRFRPEVVICGDPTIVWAGDALHQPPRPPRRGHLRPGRDLPGCRAAQPVPGAGRGGPERPQAAQGLRHRLGRDRSLRQHHRHHRPEDRGAAGPQEPDGRLGPGRTHQGMGLPARQGQGDGLRRGLPGCHVGER